MSTWIRLLPMELDSINDSDLIEPNYELEKGDLVVGEMSPFVKRLFTLSRMLDKEADQLILELKYSHSKTEQREVVAKINQFKERSQLVKLAAWISAKDELGLWTENIGFRTGFKVVTYKDETPPFIRLLGGGYGE